MPTIAVAKGSGSKRRYSYHDVLELKVIKNLLDAGLKLESVRTVFDYLKRQLNEDIVSAHLVIDGPQVILCDGDTIHPRHLNLSFRPGAVPVPVSPWEQIDLSGSMQDATRRIVAEVEKRKIEMALREASGNKGRAADQLLLVTTPEATAIADAYALLKVLLQRRPDLVPGLLVNMADTAGEAVELQERP